MASKVIRALRSVHLRKVRSAELNNCSPAQKKGCYEESNMEIRVKYNGRYISVKVQNSSCRYFECFYPHKWVTQSQGYNHVQVDTEYSCGTRNYHGCPAAPQKKRSAEIRSYNSRNPTLKQSDRCGNLL